MEHPGFNRILQYRENQIEEKEIKGIEEHLAICERCLNIDLELKSMESALGQSFEPGKATHSCPEDWEIGALVNGELKPDVSGGVSEHIKDCSYCVDRAAVYYNSLGLKDSGPIETPDPWKHRAYNALTNDITAKKQEASYFQNIIAYFQRITDPLPPLPGYAAAALALMILAIWGVMPRNAKIVTIASSEKIVLMDSEVPSSFGFTGTGETREVKNMHISLKGEDVLFKWIPVKGAVDYKFSLFSKESLLFSENLDKSTALFLSRENFDHGKLYNWIITGKTEEGRYYEYSGDFVFVE